MINKMVMEGYAGECVMFGNWPLDGPGPGQQWQGVRHGA